MIALSAAWNLASHATPQSAEAAFAHDAARWRAAASRSPILSGPQRSLMAASRCLDAPGTRERLVMAIGVFDAGMAERLQQRVNQDGAFRQVSRDMHLNVALETDGEARLITFRDGTLTAIRPFVTVTEPVDLTISGDATFW